MEWYLTVAVLLIGLGVVLLAAEFFFPTGGVLVVAGVGCFALAVGLIALYGDTQETVAAVIALSIGLPIAGSVMFYGWRRMALKSALDPDNVDATLANTPEATTLEVLKGRHGKTVTPMRPSGVVEFDGRRVDAMTEGLMIEAGAWVKCVEVRAGRVVVRRVESPGDLADMSLDDLT
jgi:membrane-bound serine protease (ClpP class)